MKKTLYELIPIKIKSVDEESATLEAIFSTEDEDRHGDVVKQNWDLRGFKKNPVILNSHNYYDALEVIGKAEKIGVKNGQLEGKIRFAVDENPKARIIFDLYKGEFLTSFSVGFIPKEWSDKGEILKSELLEVSAVSVPANQMARIKSAGINIKPLFKAVIDDMDDDDEEDEEIPEEEEKEEEEEIEEKEPEKEVKEGEENPETTPAEGEEEKGEEKPVEPKEPEPEGNGEEEKEKEPEPEPEPKESETEKNIKTISSLVRNLSESIKAETLHDEVRAKNRRTISGIVRDLLDNKNKLK